MGSELEKRVEDLLETRPKSTKKLEFEIAEHNPLGIIKRLAKIDPLSEEQQKVALIAVASSLRDMQLSGERNKALIEKCHLLKAIHDSKIYKKLGWTWDEYLYEAYKITRQAAAPYLHIAENMPEYMVGELVTQGAALKDLRLIAGEIGKAEGAEIEFIDGPESKAVVVRGSKYSLETGSEEAIRAMMRFANDQARELENERNMRKLAVDQAQDSDRKLGLQKDENKKLTEKIKKGEDDRIAMEMGEFENKLLDLVLACGKLRTTEWTARDERKAKQYWSTVCSSVIEPLKSFFDSKHYELEEREMESAPDADDERDNVEEL